MRQHTILTPHTKSQITCNSFRRAENQQTGENLDSCAKMQASLWHCGEGWVA